MSKSRRRFLAPGAGRGVYDPDRKGEVGYRDEPFRPCPDELPDAPELVEKIATQTSVFDEPEGPSDDWIDAEADLRRTYDHQRHLLEVAQAQQLRQLMDAEKRLMEVRRRAKMRHIDVSHETYTVQRMLDRARDGGRSEPAAAIKKIERLEARLDHRPDLAA